MNEFILAERFFSWLFEKQYSHRQEWRNLNRQTTKYTVPIFCQNCTLTNLHSFQVLVIDNEHYLSKTSLKPFCKIHNLDYENVINELENQ